MCSEIQSAEATNNTALERHFDRKHRDVYEVLQKKLGAWLAGGKKTNVAGKCLRCLRFMLTALGQAVANSSTRSLSQPLHLHESSSQSLSAPPTAGDTRPIKRFSTPSKALAKQQPSASSALMRLNQQSRGPLSNHTKAEADAALQDWLFSDARPSTVVEDEGFRKLCGVFGYTPPARSTIRARLKSTFQQHLNALNKEITSAAFMSLTTDGWSSAAKDSYVAVTAHWIDGEWRLHCACVGVAVSNERHISEQVCYDIERILSRVGAENVAVTSVTRDNGANFVAGVREFVISRRPAHSPFSASGDSGDLDGEAVSCFAHSCQLAVLHALEADSVAEISLLIGEIHSLVAHIRSTDRLKRRLEDLAQRDSMSRRSLVQSMPVRWSSTFRMLESVLELRSQVIELRQEEWCGYSQDLQSYNQRRSRWETSNQQGREPVEPKMSALLSCCPPAGSDKWILMQQVVDVLRLPAMIILQGEGEYYPTLSLAAMMTRLTLFKLESPQPMEDGPLGPDGTPVRRKLDSAVERLSVAALRCSLRQTLQQYMPIDSDLALLACLLDPRSKSFLDDCASGLRFTHELRGAAYRCLLRYLQFIDSTQRTAPGEGQPDSVAEPDSVSAGSTSQRNRADFHELQSFNALFHRIKSQSREDQPGRSQPATALYGTHFQTVVQHFKSYQPQCSLDWVLPRKIDATTLAPGQVIDILSWWKHVGSIACPQVAEVARRILAIPATSAPSERVFSSSGLISDGARATMQPSNVEALTVLHENNRRKPVLTSFAPTC